MADEFDEMVYGDAIKYLHSVDMPEIHQPIFKAIHILGMHLENVNLLERAIFKIRRVVVQADKKMRDFINFNHNIAQLNAEIDNIIARLIRAEDRLLAVPNDITGMYEALRDLTAHIYDPSDDELDYIVMGLLEDLPRTISDAQEIDECIECELRLIAETRTMLENTRQ